MGAWAPPLGSYPGKSGIYTGKFESIRANLKMKTFRDLRENLFFRDHTYPMRKRGKF